MLPSNVTSPRRNGVPVSPSGSPQAERLDQLWVMLGNVQNIMALSNNEQELISKAHELEIFISQKITSAAWTSKQAALPPTSPPRTPIHRAIETPEPSAPFKPRIQAPLGTLSYPEIAAKFPPQAKTTLLSVSEVKEIERKRQSRKRKTDKTGPTLMKEITKKRKA